MLREPFHSPRDGPPTIIAQVSTPPLPRDVTWDRAKRDRLMETIYYVDKKIALGGMYERTMTLLLNVLHQLRETWGIRYTEWNDYMYRMNDRRRDYEYHVEMLNKQWEEFQRTPEYETYIGEERDWKWDKVFSNLEFLSAGFRTQANPFNIATFYTEWKEAHGDMLKRAITEKREKKRQLVQKKRKAKREDYGNLFDDIKNIT